MDSNSTEGSLVSEENPSNGLSTVASNRQHEENPVIEQSAVANSGQYEVARPFFSYLLGMYLIVIVMVSIVANLIVVIVLWVRRKRMKATHWFIVALALSDICFSLLLHPMLVATSFGSDSSQLFSKAGCDLYGFGAIFFGCLDMLIHGSASISRYRSVIKGSHNSSQSQSKKFNGILLTLDVSLALFFATGPLYGWGRYQTFEFGCTVAFHDNDPKVRSYVMSLLFTVFVVPLCTCIFFYSKIIHLSYKSKLKLLKQAPKKSEQDQAACLLQKNYPSIRGNKDSTNTGTDGATTDDGGHCETHKRLHDNQFDKEKSEYESDVPIKGKKIEDKPKKAKKQIEMSLIDWKLTRLTFAMAMGFIIAWTPFASLSIWETFYPPLEIPTVFRYLASLFCKTATAFNPFIYFFMSKGFRQDFIVVMHRIRDTDPQLGWHDLIVRPWSKVKVVGTALVRTQPISALCLPSPLSTRPS